MKNLKILVLLLALSVGTLVSCSKDDNKADLKTQIIGKWMYNNMSASAKVAGITVPSETLDALLADYLPYESAYAIVEYTSAPDSLFITSYEDNRYTKVISKQRGIYTVSANKLTTTLYGATLSYNGEVSNNKLTLSLDKQGVIEVLNKMPITDEMIASLGIPMITNKEAFLSILSSPGTNINFSLHFTKA